MCLSHLIYTARPCLIHTCHAMPMPRPCHALTMPFFSRPRHSTAVGRRPVGYLPAFSFFRLPRRVPRRLFSEAYQSSSQRSIPTTVKSGSSTLQKANLLNCWTSCSDISGYHADFHEGHGTVGVWQRRGMGTACCVWIGLERHTPHPVGLLNSSQRPLPEQHTTNTGRYLNNTQQIQTDT
jgi:hypothetical protein